MAGGGWKEWEELKLAVNDGVVWCLLVVRFTIVSSFRAAFLARATTQYHPFLYGADTYALLHATASH